MAEGLERRPKVVDNLRGAAAVEPVTRAVPGISAPSTPTVPDSSFATRITDQVVNFAGKTLQDIQTKRQERSMLDGQLKALQGKTFDAVEMEGDKWALEGYRLVSAQSMGSSLLRAQEKQINAGAYEDDPEQYRETLAERVTEMTKDIPDERTRMLATDALMKQMPGLLDLHMRKNLAFKEQQNFDALAQSVDVISRDSSSTGALLAFATGESEATAGLSVERRRKAVVQGVVNAFQNNNPAAFAHLDAAGFFKTDNLTASQIQAVHSARNAYETRLRQQFNGELAAEMTELDDRVKNGEVGPLVAAEEAAKIMAKHGLRMRASEGNGIYNRARAGVEFAEGTRGLNAAAAGASGDYDLQARLMRKAVIHQESRGNPDAVSPVGAVGVMQLMPGTMIKPGFGMKNIFAYAKELGVPYDLSTDVMAEARRLARNPEVNAAMGTDYLATMLKRYNGNMEKALAAYNWGAGRADKWDGDHAKLPAETRGYIKNIMGSLKDGRPDPEGARVEAERNLELARKRAGLKVLERVGPMMAENDELFTKNQLDFKEWRANRQAIYKEWGLELDEQRLNEERGMMRQVVGDRVETLTNEATAAADTATAVKLETSIATADEVLRERQAAFTAGTDPMSLGEINDEYMGSVLKAYRESGADLDPKRISKSAADLVTNSAAIVRKALAAGEERAVIGNAETANTVGTLPPQMIDKAVKRFRKDLAGRVAEYRAENPDASPGEVGAVARSAEIDYLAENGIVDETLKQQINLAAGDNWTDAKGDARPSVVVGVHSFLSLMAKNPDLAYQYVADPAARGRMLAAAHMVMTKFPDRDVFATVDLANRKDPVANEMYSVVQQIGLGAAKPVSADDNATRVNDALSAARTGNLTNSWLTRNTDAITPDLGLVGDGIDLLNPFSPLKEFVAGDREDAASALITGSALHALGSSEFEVADVNAARNVSTEAVNAQFGQHVQRFIEEVVPHMPNTSNDGAVSIALDYVTKRGAVMGSGYVMPKANEPSIRSQMFPGKTGISTAAVNTAVVQWMQSEQAKEANGVLHAWDEDQMFYNSGVPEYTVSRIGDKYVAHLPGYGSVALPIKEIGDLYISNR